MVLRKGLRFRFALLHGGVAAVAVSIGLLIPQAKAQDAPGMSDGPMPGTQAPVPIERKDPAEQAPVAPLPPPVSHFDKAIFLKPIPSEDLKFLSQFNGVPADELMRDKQFRRILKNIVPDCMFHYGRDMPLSEALDTVMKTSKEPVQIRDGRYLLVSGHMGPYLQGRGFLWIDLRDGLGLGGFFFHPTNGEPTPSVNIFSRQVKEEALAMSELPPAFSRDVADWDAQASVPAVTTRYFISGANEKILLEHDEDFCSPSDGTIAPSGDCDEMNADASDLDMNAAVYLDQTRHVTNATAWMINDPDQVAWVQVRDRTCAGGPDPLRCHVRMTRERTHTILRRGRRK